MACRTFYLGLKCVRNVGCRDIGHSRRATLRREHLSLYLFGGYAAESACFKACGGADYVCVCQIVVSGIHEQLNEAAR